MVGGVVVILVLLAGRGHDIGEAVVQVVADSEEVIAVVEGLMARPTPAPSSADGAVAGASVRIERWVPQASVMREATMMVGHGGAGSGAGGVGSGRGVNFGWQAGSGRLVAEVSLQHGWQIAVWRPGEARLSVALAQAPSGSWPVADEGPY